MSYTLKGLFDEYTAIKSTKALAINVITFYQRFTTRSESHALFFGSGLVGVYPIRWMDSSDSIYWTEDIMGISEMDDLQRDMAKVPGMIFDKKGNIAKISGNALNMMFAYALYRLNNATDLPAEVKRQAMIHTVATYLAKHLASQITRRFHFNADPQIAAALYESLDNKTDLKKYGTWNNLLLARGEQAVDPQTGIHFKTMETMEPTAAVIYLVNDLQDRLVDVLNLLTEKFHEVKKNQGKILSGSMITEIEGEKMLREYVRKEQQLISDMDRIASDPRDLIRDDLAQMLCEYLTADKKPLLDALQYYSDNFNAPKTKYNELQRMLIVYVLTEMRTGKLNISDIPSIIKRVRSVFRASQTQRPEVLEIKRQFKDVVTEAIPRARDSVQVSTTIALALYIVLRMLSMQRYR